MKIDIVQLEIVKKYSADFDIENDHVYGVASAGRIFQKEIGSCNIEYAGLLCLDFTNKIINYSNVAIGNIENVNIPVAQIIKTALVSNASKIIVAHNHPSGVLEITANDISTTKSIGNLARMLGIQLIDSLIVTNSDDILSIREHINDFD